MPVCWLNSWNLGLEFPSSSDESVGNDSRHLPMAAIQNQQED